jgi:exodeoxyribonuclease VII large subunit
VSPLNTLQRGYAIVFKAGKILHNAALAQMGDQLQVKLAQGELVCRVE